MARGIRGAMGSRGGSALVAALGAALLLAVAAPAAAGSIHSLEDLLEKVRASGPPGLGLEGPGLRSLAAGGNGRFGRVDFERAGDGSGGTIQRVGLDLEGPISVPKGPPFATLPGVGRPGFVGDESPAPAMPEPGAALLFAAGAAAVALRLRRL